MTENPSGQIALSELSATNFHLPEESWVSAIETVRTLREPLLSYPAASGEARNRVRTKILKAKRRFESVRLFGTSGIRGKAETTRKNGTGDKGAVATFEEKGLLTLEMIYFFGRALGRYLHREGPEGPAYLGLDVRPSSLLFGCAITQGMIDEGRDISFIGICTTPTATLVEEACFVMVTASHNPYTENGIKTFLCGAPIAVAVEDLIEAAIREFDMLAREGKSLPVRPPESRGRISEGKNLILNRQRALFKAELARAGLAGGALAGAMQPLDLAFGAAAAPAAFTDLSPQLEILLEAGAAIVGYGTERDPFRTNRCIGAAYPYGECRVMDKGRSREVAPRPGEMLSFAQGRPGYGAGLFSDAGDEEPVQPPLHPSIYFPRDHVFKVPELLEEAAVVGDGHHVFLNLGNAPAKLRNQVEEELSTLRLLPAMSVDCDADRFLVTDQALAKATLPFVTGDLMLMLFARYLDPEISRVVFTVESGITIEKYLDAIEVPFEMVTVGDRAVSECLLHLAGQREGEAKGSIGGEPSGHMLLSDAGSGTRSLVDDPLIFHLKLLGILQSRDKDLAGLVREIKATMPEVHTARKPDAWARDENGGGEGITLQEKMLLELRRRGAKNLVLSEYAAKFIPAYMKMFAEGYRQAFYRGIPKLHKEYPGVAIEVQLSHAFARLEKQGLDLSDDEEWFRTGKLLFFSNGSRIETVEAHLRLNREGFRGPQDIHLAFFAKNGEGKWFKTGEVVSRNSGTSAKNGAYNKLFFIHYPTGLTIGDAIIRQATQKMAEKRAAFTDAYVLEVLRKKERRSRGV